MSKSHFQWNSSEKKRPTYELPQGNSILEAFFLTCKRFRDHDACMDELSGPWSYNKLKKYIISCSLLIKESRASRIGILLPSSVFSMIVVLATLLANKIPVMINWSLGNRELKFLKEDAQCDFIVSSTNFLDKISYTIPESLNFNCLFLENMKKKLSLFQKLQTLGYSCFPVKKLLQAFNVHKKTLEDTAVILFTSGTEDRPKIVPLTHGNILSNHKGCLNFLDFHDSLEIILGYLPPFHSFGFTVTSLLPLLSGFRVVYTTNPLEGKKIVGLVQKYKVTLLCTTPSLSPYITRNVENRQQLDSLKLVIFGGEQAFAHHYSCMQECAVNAVVIQGYGVTECSPVIAISSFDDPKAEGVGRPIINTELLIVHHETFKILPVGHVGLILVSGPGVFSGYLHNKTNPFISYPERTWYITGDLGRVNENGVLILEGRLKRFVKIAGEMISLSAVESVLTKYFVANQENEVLMFVVCGLEHMMKKTQLCVFSQILVSLQEVNAALRKSGMNNLIKLSFIHHMDAIPLLGSGKPNYAMLLKLAKELFS